MLVIGVNILYFSLFVKNSKQYIFLTFILRNTAILEGKHLYTLGGL
jgi:hypothetical protein